MERRTTKTQVEGPGCLVQLLWTLFIGLWLGQLWAAVAWVLVVTIIGMPIGIAMLNRLPAVVALRKRASVTITRSAAGTTVSRTPQRPLLLRALYFLLIGWWFSALWIEAAFVLLASFIGIPLGYWMLDRIPAVVSLQR